MAGVSYTAGMGDPVGGGELITFCGGSGGCVRGPGHLQLLAHKLPGLLARYEKKEGRHQNGHRAYPGSKQWTHHKVFLISDEILSLAAWRKVSPWSGGQAFSGSQTFSPAHTTVS